MTSDELEMKIGDIDPRLGIKPSLDPKVITFNDETIYSFIEKLFSFNGLIHFIQSGDVRASKWFALQRTILEYWTSKDSQTISKDSEKENGSTMLSKKITSNDSQKKTKEHLIHDFIKDAALMGFQCSPNQFYDAQTADIDVFDGESKYIMDICFLSGVRTFMVDDMEIDDLKRYSWLFTRVSTLISEWRKDEELRQMIGAK